MADVAKTSRLTVVDTKGVGKPTKNDYEPPAIDVDEAPASSEMVDRAPDDENDSCAPSGGIFCATDGKEDPEV